MTLLDEKTRSAAKAASAAVQRQIRQDVIADLHEAERLMLQVRGSDTLTFHSSDIRIALGRAIDRLREVTQAIEEEKPVS